MKRPSPAVFGTVKRGLNLHLLPRPMIAFFSSDYVREYEPVLMFGKGLLPRLSLVAISEQILRGPPGDEIACHVMIVRDIAVDSFLPRLQEQCGFALLCSVM